MKSLWSRTLISAFLILFPNSFLCQTAAPSGPLPTHLKKLLEKVADKCVSPGPIQKSLNPATNGIFPGLASRPQCLTNCPSQAKCSSSAQEKLRQFPQNAANCNIQFKKLLQNQNKPCNGQPNTNLPRISEVTSRLNTPYPNSDTPLTTNSALSYQQEVSPCVVPTQNPGPLQQVNGLSITEKEDFNSLASKSKFSPELQNKPEHSTPCGSTSHANFLPFSQSAANNKFQLQKLQQLQNLRSGQRYVNTAPTYELPKKITPCGNLDNVIDTNAATQITQQEISPYVIPSQNVGLNQQQNNLNPPVAGVFPPLTSRNFEISQCPCKPECSQACPISRSNMGSVFQNAVGGCQMKKNLQNDVGSGLPRICEFSYPQIMPCPNLEALSVTNAAQTPKPNVSPCTIAKWQNQMSPNLQIPSPSVIGSPLNPQTPVFFQKEMPSTLPFASNLFPPISVPCQPSVSSPCESLSDQTSLKILPSPNIPTQTCAPISTNPIQSVAYPNIFVPINMVSDLPKCPISFLPPVFLKNDDFCSNHIEEKIITVPINLEINIPPPQVPESHITIITASPPNPPVLATSDSTDVTLEAYPSYPLPPIIIENKKSKLKSWLPLMLIAMTADDGCCCCSYDGSNSCVPVPFPIPIPTNNPIIIGTSKRSPNITKATATAQVS